MKGAHLAIIRNTSHRNGAVLIRQLDPLGECPVQLALGPLHEDAAIIAVFERDLVWK